jgi:hypothetical protein
MTEPKRGFVIEMIGPNDEPDGELIIDAEKLDMLIKSGILAAEDAHDGAAVVGAFERILKALMDGVPQEIIGKVSKEQLDAMTINALDAFLLTIHGPRDRVGH